MTKNKPAIGFSAPAPFDKWEQYSLPIGNAYLGAGFFGGVAREKIVLNEKTLWVGGPSAKRPGYIGGNKPNSYKYVRQVQQLLVENRYDEALPVLDKLTGDGDGFGSYQLLCDAYLSFSNIDESIVTDYNRSLSLDDGICTTTFSYTGAKHKREAFANYPSNVVCIRLSSDKSSRICVCLSLDEMHDGGKVHVEDNIITYDGALEDNGLRYCGEFRLEHKGGELICGKDRIMVEHADEVLIYFSAATDYANVYPNYRNGINPSETVKSTLDKAIKKGFEKLLEEHLADFVSLSERVALNLNNAGFSDEYTDVLLEKYRNGDKTAKSQLENLYFRFGRYMLISSSRNGTLPANLQGVWNEQNCPPWCCDYHINVNLQMNYWPAYNTNLAETAKPLVDYLDAMRPAGRVTAKEYYGIVSDTENPENGWIAHTQSNPFGFTAPGWDFYWGWSTAAVAWLMQNIWEYYEFTEDKDYLENRIYPIMKESVTFYKQWLIYDEKQGRLVSSPTYSPEHGPVTIGNTYEQLLIDQLYADFITASEILGKDEQLRAEIAEQKKLLKPFSIGKRGQLKEWYDEDEPDFDSTKIQPFHRHISQLLALYPGKAINRNTPELMNAAITTLNERGDESTGWSRANKLNLWSRTGDGNRTYSILEGLLSACTFPNLFDFHPPFQLDGNFGGTAGIAEMLVQSHEGYIYPLAALPDEWADGRVSGLCARGGFEIGIEWQDKKAVKIEIASHNANECRIKTELTKVIGNKGAVNAEYSGGILSFTTEKDGVYTVEV